MTRINATLTSINGQRAAVVECVSADGSWLGASRVDSPLRSYRLGPNAGTPAEQDRAAIYEVAYTWASQNAAAHGGTLDRFGWAS